MRLEGIMLLMLCGCTTSIKHISDPRIIADGYNFICQGFEVGEKLEVSIDACYNLSPNKGEFIVAELQYNW